MQPYKTTFANDNSEELLHALRNIPDPPKALYIRGSHLRQTGIRIAVVGARAMSVYGQRIARTLAMKIASRGGVLVSGLAFGIDVTVHEAALMYGGSSIAVLPAGVEDDAITPRAHVGIAQKIVKSGFLVSEYPSGTPYRKDLYLRRNRLISGIADVTVIIEAALPSGSLTTAQHALHQGKDIWAVPGRIDENTAKGVNWLISEGAQPLVDIDQFVAQYCGEEESKKDLSEQPVLKLLLTGPMTLEELCISLNRDASSLLGELSRLEVSGRIIRGRDNSYSLLD